MSFTIVLIKLIALINRSNKLKYNIGVEPSNTKFPSRKFSAFGKGNDKKIVFHPEYAVEHRIHLNNANYNYIFFYSSDELY